MAKRHFCHLIISIFVDFAFLNLITSEDFMFTLSIQCLDTFCVRQDLGHFRSRVECASRCSASSTCVGFSYTADGVCLNLQNGCTLHAACTAIQPSLRVYWKQRMFCDNNGTWNDLLQTCDCVGGWVGLSCERHPYNCKELKTFRYAPKTYRVYVDVYRNQSRLVYTQCVLYAESCHTFIFSNGGSANNNKTWTEYLHGFELGPWHWWLGLENIWAFNQMGHTNVVFCIIVQPNDFAWEFGHENFTITDQSQGYSFTSDYKYNISYGNYFMTTRYTPEDIISLSQGFPFSTPDVDRDADDSQNCAALYGTGWWFNSCTSGEQVNPLGIIYKDGIIPPNKIRLPGINSDDLEFNSNFQSVLLVFID